MRCAILCFGLVYACSLSAQPSVAAPPAAAKESPAANGAKAPTPPSDSQEATLSQAAARRNENVHVNLIDNDATKEANIRLGDSVTVISQPLVEAGYYAGEHGRPPSEAVAALPAGTFRGFHGELYELLQNSVFNARTFFQAGAVKPSRQNNYGGRFVERVKGLGVFTGNLSQRKVRGMVNGNALVPLASERTPLATDAAVCALVARFLAAYPDELPNRADLD
ncbi:MAG: hypothetical protein NTW28_25690, partial [Candidatus Solibacter sp.]|nr:hypothetical protein [Candidatus Solibacter sp.]